jgi:hypothetical protein
MAELTDSLTTWTDWVKEYLDDETWRTATGISAVMYGDQEKIATIPLVCVEPSEKRREFNGTGRRTRLDFEVFILIYHGAMATAAENRQAVDTLAEEVEARLHTALTCDGLVINSLVTNLTSGAANKGGTLIRATRLTFTAQSQMHLPMGV